MTPTQCKTRHTRPPGYRVPGVTITRDRQRSARDIFEGQTTLRVDKYQVRDGARVSDYVVCVGDPGLPKCPSRSDVQAFKSYYLVQDDEGVPVTAVLELSQKIRVSRQVQ